MSHPKIWVEVLGGEYGFIGRALCKKIRESDDMVAVAGRTYLRKDVTVNLIRPHSFMDVMERCTPLINQKTPVIHVSSLSVVHTPFTKYALLKRLEEILLPGSCILRLPTVYGREIDDMKCVIDIWNEQSKAGQPILVFSPDRKLEFVYIDKVITILMGLIRMKERPHLMEYHSDTGPEKLLDIAKTFSSDILVVKRMK